MQFDLIIIGSGPGGYVAAIRASQLGLKVAIVERENLGGICLNWGCIPTKALLKSAQVYHYVQHADEFGVKVKDYSVDFTGMVKRSRQVAEGMSKGVQFLMKKNKIEVINGTGKVLSKGMVRVSNSDGSFKDYESKHIILATGARSRVLPNVQQNGKTIIGYREAMTLQEQPKTMVVVGSGAIGSEFSNFYNFIGTKVVLVEFMPNILPVEDVETSKTMEKIFKKQGIDVRTSTSVEQVETDGKSCKVKLKSAKGEEIIECDVVLSAAGIVANIEGLGLEENGIKTENGKVLVDSFYQTNIPGIYAIGDIIPGPALAHLASHEAIVCVEKIAGHQPVAIDYGNIPGCTYTYPEVASVGYTEKAALDAGYEIKVGKFPFSASGKASAAGAKDGFVKVIFDAKYGEFLGAHMVGVNVTEMIAEVVVARKLETTAREIITAIHPHPTMSEAIMEAAAAAYDEVIHL
jgi:dihydrolipoamide dehydrogenase